MLSLKEQMLKDNIDRVLGKRQEADLVFKLKTGKLTDQEIEDYYRARDEDTQYFKELFNFAEPQQPTIIEPEENKYKIISNEILKDDDNQIRGNQNEGNQNIVSID